MEEIWKDVPNYEGIYQISNYGRVKSFRAYNSYTKKYYKREKILNTKIDTNGYYVVSLCNKNQKYFRIHRLVAKVFIPNPNNYPIINHKDENKLNNRVDNLEWCTYSYNNSYGTRNKNISKPILQYDLDGNFLNEYCSINEASRKLNINHSSIIFALQGKSKQSHGYIWKYKK